jgi:hypothetical protein
MEIVRALMSRDKQWRGEIIRRTSMTFGFRVYRWHEEEVVGGHWDAQGGLSETVTSSAEDAEKELRARIPELADAHPAAA